MTTVTRRDFVLAAAGGLGAVASSRLHGAHTAGPDEKAGAEAENGSERFAYPLSLLKAVRGRQISAPAHSAAAVPAACPCPIGLTVLRFDI